MNSPVRRRRFSLFDLIAHSVLAISVLGIVAVYILWSVGHRPGGWEEHIGSEDSQCRLMICSRDNRLVVGLYSPSQPGMWGRRSWGQGSMNQLVDDPDSYVSADMFGWGIAAPHWVWALVLTTIPIFWWLVWREGEETRERQSGGLCRSCGYDIRASDQRCPECGAVVPSMALRRSKEATG
jgi:predicted RNA-binding Zn-ribbon protein involved in translation (DUF1610 family)